MGKPRQKDLPDLGRLRVPGQEIALKAVPRAARNAIVEDAEGRLRVMVTAAPENGRATEAVRRLLAQAMGTAASHLQLRRGAASRDKLFVYTGPAG